MAHAVVVETSGINIPTNTDVDIWAENSHVILLNVYGDGKEPVQYRLPVEKEDVERRFNGHVFTVRHASQAFGEKMFSVISESTDLATDMEDLFQSGQDDWNAMGFGMD